MALTVLVVEDDPDARELVSVMLADAKFQVRYAENGRVAITMAREHPPDAIIMDLHLPEIDGSVAAQAIRADSRLGGIPIVAYTISYRPLLAWETELFDAIVDKRTSPGALIDILRSVTRRRSDGSP
jgi:CheY-like chemotaxis protein